MSMEDSQRSLNNSNTHGPEEKNIDRETEEEITEESIEGSQRSLNNSNTHGPEENIERETEEPIVGSLRYLSSVIEESCDHDLFSRRPARMTNSEATSARMTYSEATSFSGFRSVRSEGSSASASSFGFPILQSERNISPVRMVKAKRTKRGKEKGWRRYSLLLCCRFCLSLRGFLYLYKFYIFSLLIIQKLMTSGLANLSSVCLKYYISQGTNPKFSLKS
ncbi:PREDICTED: uncharacterized protein LOC104743294 [Camelina sativa]|uniref:Uncharacterized protein LOC104743294 n=1 Tax=Camelina sativa TaxID=90675 RepID=A0ABM1QW49_CAMSA|nr:PREDICTED: uncharacterized protein LOC104743294 [Camelina sativa]